MPSEAKFTPGPWHWEIGEIDRGTQRGKPIRLFLWTGTVGSGSILRPSWNEFDGEMWQTWVTAKEADAALIAAAPELYDTEHKLCNEVSGLLGGFEAALRDLIGHTNFNVLQRRVEEARAALAKAEGNTGSPQADGAKDSEAKSNV